MKCTCGGHLARVYVECNAPAGIRAWMSALTEKFPWRGLAGQLAGGAAISSGAVVDVVIGKSDGVALGSGTSCRRASSRSQWAGEMLCGLL